MHLCLCDRFRLNRALGVEIDVHVVSCLQVHVREMVTVDGYVRSVRGEIQSTVEINKGHETQNHICVAPTQHLSLPKTNRPATQQHTHILTGTYTQEEMEREGARENIIAHKWRKLFCHKTLQQLQ